ncbi:MAG: hypothetical protein QXR58_02485 [Candidatus Micrarchaeaceae archaeon]
MPKKNLDLDSLINDQEEREKRDEGRLAESNAPHSSKIRIGIVEHFFDRLGVAAIKLEGGLKVGDIVEIGDEEEAIRQRVKSMQINKKEVDFAEGGDPVGILVRCPVKPGSIVYKLLV